MESQLGENGKCGSVVYRCGQTCGSVIQVWRSRCGSVVTKSDLQPSAGVSKAPRHILPSSVFNTPTNSYTQRKKFNHFVKKKLQKEKGNDGHI